MVLRQNHIISNFPFVTVLSHATKFICLTFVTEHLLQNLQALCKVKTFFVMVVITELSSYLAEKLRLDQEPPKLTETSAGAVLSSPCHSSVSCSPTDFRNLPAVACTGCFATFSIAVMTLFFNAANLSGLGGRGKTKTAANVCKFDPADKMHSPQCSYIDVIWVMSNSLV